MKVAQLVNLTEIAVARKTGFSLNNLHKIILQECCKDESKTYTQIALEFNYSPTYLKKKVIPVLWKMLAETFNEKVTKANCRSILEKHLGALENVPLAEVVPDRPEGPVPLESPFYLHRFDLEQQGYETLLGSGALLCLSGTSQVGKTSLLTRLLDRVEGDGYRTIRLSFNRASTAVLSSVEKLVRWLCANISQWFEVEVSLEKFWREEAGSLSNCSRYLQQYILSRTSSPIVLALDEFDRLFTHPTIAHDFTRLLRSWYEEAKYSPLWQKLRVVLVYSTEANLLSPAGKLPIDFGSTLEVSPLNAEQVRELAGTHQLYLTLAEGDRLHALLGGFPDLVRKVLYHAAREKCHPLQLLGNVATDAGMFSDRLQEKWHWLKTHPDLLSAFWQVVNSKKPLILDPLIAFRLQSLGLVGRQEDGVVVSCELYRQYFRERSRFFGELVSKDYS